jgi:hypothetical protein
MQQKYLPKSDSKDGFGVPVELGGFLWQKTVKFRHISKI